MCRVVERLMKTGHAMMAVVCMPGVMGSMMMMMMGSVVVPVHVMGMTMVWVSHSI